MENFKILETDRLTLRPFSMDDAEDIQRLAGNMEIASKTLNIPHPYEDGMAEEWIGTHQKKFEEGVEINYAVVLRDRRLFIGAVGLMDIDRNNDRANLGYWIGKPFWSMGYCTEAARAVISHAFRQLGVNRVYASHLTRNPASGRVMKKIGMTFEGRLRQHIKKWDQFEDVNIYGILRNEFDENKS